MPDKKSPIRPKPKRRRKKRHPNRTVRNVNPGFVLPAYLTDPDISIDRLSRWVVRDADARSPAEANHLLRIAIERIEPRLVKMFEDEDLALVSRACRIYERLQRAISRLAARTAFGHATISDASSRGNGARGPDCRGASPGSSNE